MFRYTRDPVTPRLMTVGETVRFDDMNEWTVKAVTANFVALTRPVTDADRAEAQAEVDEHEEDSPYLEFAEDYCDQLDECVVFYTVVDWRNSVRGPCNLIGQAWGDGTYSEAECSAMLAEFEVGELEVSHSNRTPIGFADTSRSASTLDATRKGDR